MATTIPTICGKTVQGNPRTLVDLLQRHAAATTTSPADAANTTASAISSGFSWIDDSGNVARKLTYADLEREARVVAQGLQANKAHGQRVLLIFEPGLDFVVGFFGCVYAGAIAVPVYPPLKDEDFFKVPSPSPRTWRHCDQCNLSPIRFLIGWLLPPPPIFCD
jgi:acyl-CoA synthetase (AMP-forming)/AMP-acid ligase II